MQHLMLKLDRGLTRHRWLVLGAWVVALVVALPFAAKQGDHLTGGGFGVPGSQSDAVAQLTKDDFGGAGHAQLGAVVIARDGASPAAALARVRAAVAAAPDVEVGGRPLRRGQTTILPLATTVDDVKSTDIAKDLRERLGIGQGAETAEAGVSTHLIGQGALWAGLQDVSKRSLAEAEGIGFPIVALILLAVFGSLAAATLPLVLGLVSVLITGGAIYFLSRMTDMSVFVTNMASMVGIGVAVDYSLFVLARYREEVHAGLAPERARGVAMATSGVAVAFSGLTVMASLGGLFLVESTSLRSMALGAIVVVAVSVLGAATLLPVLIRLFGHRAYTRGRIFSILHVATRNRSRRRRGSTDPDAPARDTFWESWTARVSRRPGLSAILAGGLLLALAFPALSLDTQDGALRQFAKTDETRVGFEAAAAVTGPGASSALKVVVPADRAEAARATLAADAEIADVAAPVTSDDGRSALLVATPRHDGESAEAKAAVERLREQMPAAKIGGNAAGLLDFDDLVAGSMWKIVLFVLGLSFVVLLVVLRSIVLPIKAVVMNLLSVGAAFGVLQLVFGTVDTITPPLILAVVFGLSMDYEVFLLSRIRERYAATGDTRRAVAEGLASSARTITSAAVIMASVFMVFVFTGVPSIRQLGLGNAVAILVDATLVRLVLVPAAMELMGRWNWWLPRPLDRILPKGSFEEAPAALRA